jgi:hypothetical protein
MENHHISMAIPTPGAATIISRPQETFHHHGHTQIFLKKKCPCPDEKSSLTHRPPYPQVLLPSPPAPKSHHSTTGIQEKPLGNFIICISFHVTDS